MRAKLMYRTNEHGTAVQKTAPIRAGPCLDGPSMSPKDTSGSKSDVQCPTCDRVFASDRAVKVHHSKAHGESIAGETFECAWCGEENTRDPAHVARSENSFCDEGCFGAYKSENQHGEDNPAWNGGPDVLTCAQCGDEYEHKPNETYNSRFCSRGCKGEWQATRKVGQDHPQWKPKVDLECAYCGGTFSVKPSVVEARRCCSRECFAGWRSETIRGPAHPNWKGGTFPYGEGWTETKREAVRERQGRICLGCGMDEDANGQRLSVHHVTKARALQDAPPNVQHAEDNLVALCRSCHKYWERMSPLRPEVEDA